MGQMFLWGVYNLYKFENDMNTLFVRSLGVHSACAVCEKRVQYEIGNESGGVETPSYDTQYNF